MMKLFIDSIIQYYNSINYLFDNFYCVIESNSLEQTRKVFPKRKATVSSVANKYNDLCTSKAELVQRELRILDKK